MRLPRWIVGIAVAYLVLLAASYAERIFQRPVEHLLPPLMHSAQIREVGGEGRTPREITIAYADYPGASAAASGATPEEFPVLLVHGSPGDSEVFRSLAEQLGGQRRLIVPDLPGFGYSSHDIADYSFQAHAAYLWELLDQLGVRKVHLVGFSMGGGVVLCMAHSASERVESVTLLSAIGVQEMELLGDYHLNHIAHGVQLAGLWALRAFFPRFGSWNRTDMGIPYARNFYDSDQRPLRAYLANYDGAMLILHGKKDPLVPVEAAYEHSRLAPQSELVVLDGDHFMTFLNPAPLAREMVPFFAAAEEGTAPHRAAADPGRMELSRLPADGHHWPKPLPVTAFVIVVALVAAAFFSGDLACLIAALMVADGRAGFLLVAIACAGGTFFGDTALFLLGKFGDGWLARRAPLRWFAAPAKVSGIRERLRRSAASFVLASRLRPGDRAATGLAAGSLAGGWAKFPLYFLLAALAWTGLLVAGLAAALAPLMRTDFAGGFSLSAKLCVILLVFLVFRLVARNLSRNHG